MRRYFGAQWKRALRSLPGALLANLLLLAAAALLLLYLTRLFAPSEEGTAKLKLGIVGGQGQTYLGTGLGILNNMDSSRLAISYEQLDKEAAAEKRTIRYVGGGLEAGLNSALIREAGSAAEVILKETERGIYAAEGYFDAHGARDRHAKLLTEINLRYLGTVLNRNRNYNAETVVALAGSDLAQYYRAALLCFLLFASGVSALPFAAGRAPVLGRLLTAEGVSCGAQLLSEYFAYFGLQTLAFLPLLPLLREMFAGLLPALFFATALQFLLYELAEGLLAGAFLQLFAGIFLAFLSGCFYPLAFFPARMQALSRALPSGQCFRYLERLLAGEAFGTLFRPGAVLLLWALAFLMLAGVLRAGRRER